MPPAEGLRYMYTSASSSALPPRLLPPGPSLRDSALDTAPVPAVTCWQVHKGQTRVVTEFALVIRAQVEAGALDAARFERTALPRTGLQVT
jgi:hypothetical protein